MKRTLALLLILILTLPLLASCSEKKDFTGVNCNIGILEYCKENGGINDLKLLISTYNEQPGHAAMQVQKYDDAKALHSAILSGDVDMVITPDWFLLKDYVKEGLLVSLEEIAPALFEKDVLIENVVNATKVDGVCWYLPVDFDISGEYVADPGFFKDGKLFEDRLAYYAYIKENDPDYFKNYTSSDILNTFTNDLDEWIDWETNTCHFDDGTFAPLLELCAMGSPAEKIGDFRILSKTELEMFWNHYTKAESFMLKDAVQNYRFTDAAEAQEYQKGLPEPVNGIYGPTTWVQVDFPMPSRVHEGFAIDPHNLYAIVDHEDTKEACADFLGWLILEDVEEEFKENDERPLYPTRKGWDRFSINRDETDRYLKRLWDCHRDPEEEAANSHPEIASKHPDARDMARYIAQDFNAKCGEDRYEVTWDYINKADHLRYYQNDIHTFIRIDAQKAFSGFYTPEEAAEKIQKRVSQYLAEQS